VAVQCVLKEEWIVGLRYLFCLDREVALWRLCGDLVGEGEGGAY
jgi:hypothetical protein